MKLKSRSLRHGSQTRPVVSFDLASAVDKLGMLVSEVRMTEARAEAQTALTIAFQSGDHEAFAHLVERHQHELRLHCYRMLASLDDAEDLLQETFLPLGTNAAPSQGARLCGLGSIGSRPMPASTF